MKRLKDDADGAAAKAGQLIFIEPAQILAGDRDGARIGPLQTGHHHQQRRLAGAGRAEQADGLAATYIEGDVAQDVDAGGAAAERQIDAAEHDGVAGDRMPRNVVHASDRPQSCKHSTALAIAFGACQFIWVAAVAPPNRRGL